MTPEQRAAMYGPTSDTTSSVNFKEPEEQPLTLGGSGRDTVMLRVSDKGQLVLPSIVYVQRLERQVQLMERELKRLKNTNRNLTMTVNKLITAVRAVESQLESKLDKPF